MDENPGNKNLLVALHGDVIEATGTDAVIWNSVDDGGPCKTRLDVGS